MGDDIASYRIRIGTHCTKLRSITKPTKFDAAPLATYFFGIITAALLIIAGTEVNPGPPAMEQQILSAINNLKQEISDLTHNQSSNFKNKENEKPTFPAIYAGLRIADLPGPWHYKG